MSTRPVQLTPALAEAVKRAQVGLESSGELPRPGGYRSPLDAEDRAVVARILADGTYRRLADAVPRLILRSPTSSQFGGHRARHR